MKKPGPYATQYIVSAEVARESGDELVEWIRDAWNTEPVQVERLGHRQLWLDTYFSSEVEGALAERVLREQPGVRAVCVRRCEPRDWLSFWRTHFRPMEVGRRLRVQPDWDPPPGEEEARLTLVLRPGMSFGTGLHFTTRFCLEMIDDLCEKSLPDSFLDVGCGSGILGIAAARLGVARVMVVDNDADALSEAVENARLNGVQKRIEFREMDITVGKVEETFDLVVANLYRDVLLQASRGLSEMTRRCLVVSGLREHEADAIADGFAFQGAREISRDGDGEWAGLALNFEQ